jgi:hypothetical protein
LEVFTSEKAEVIVSCARCNEVAEIAFLELHGADHASALLNLRCPSKGSRPARFVGMSNDYYAPIHKVRKCVPVNGCACA